MRKQLIILFAVLLAVFAAIGCTTDTEDQPIVEDEDQLPEPVEEEPIEEDPLTDDTDIIEEEPVTDDEFLEEDDQVTDDVMNDTDEEEQMMDNETMGAGETVVTIDEDGFDPADTEVSVGETVTWINQDDVVHTVTSDDGTFDSGDLDEGESFSYTFDEAGTYDYGSDEDPFFDGTITVTEEEGDQTMEDEQENGDVVVVPADS